MGFSFRHIPVTSAQDSTANFEQLIGVIEKLENEIQELRNIILKIKT